MINFDKYLEEHMKDPEFAQAFEEERYNLEAELAATRIAERLVQTESQSVCKSVEDGGLCCYAYIDFDNETRIQTETYLVKPEERTAEHALRLGKIICDSLIQVLKDRILKQTKKETHMGAIETPAVVEKVEEVKPTETVVETTTTETTEVAAEKE